MSKVRANQRGYFGGMVREAGDIFDVPDGAKASWWGPVGDDDAPAPAAPAAKRKPKADTVAAPTAEPFGDAPAPVRVENEINAALSGTQPDWIAPDQDI